MLSGTLSHVLAQYLKVILQRIFTEENGLVKVEGIRQGCVLRQIHQHSVHKLTRGKMLTHLVFEELSILKVYPASAKMLRVGTDDDHALRSRQCPENCACVIG